MQSVFLLPIYDTSEKSVDQNLVDLQPRASSFTPRHEISSFKSFLFYSRKFNFHNKFRETKLCHLFAVLSELIMLNRTVVLLGGKQLLVRFPLIASYTTNFFQIVEPSRRSANFTNVVGIILKFQKLRKGSSGNVWSARTIKRTRPSFWRFQSLKICQSTLPNGIYKTSDFEALKLTGSSRVHTSCLLIQL